MSNTKVGNIKNYSIKNIPNKCVRIDRATIFGNPFKIGEHGSRDEVIERYKRYFLKRIKYDSDFRKAVKKLKGKVLLCWCRPLPCHGDVIAEWLNNE